MANLPDKRDAFDHGGYRYDVKSIIKYVRDGDKLPSAIKKAYPTTPIDSIKGVVEKVKKTPYYLAYKDAKTEILNNAGPELQQNLLDLAFTARSETVRFMATDKAIDRVYGASTEEKVDVPAMVLNFSFGASADAGKTPDTRIVIDGK